MNKRQRVRKHLQTKALFDVQDKEVNNLTIRGLIMGNEFEDVVLAKLNPKERELLAQEIGLEIEKAMGRADKTWEAATDPENIRRSNLGRLYAATPEKTAPTTNRQLEAATAWSRGERWPSTAKYPSMDFEAMDKAREAAKGGGKS
jgi:hypothetical protein